jgi:hypothetical protein
VDVPLQADQIMMVPLIEDMLNSIAIGTLMSATHARIIWNALLKKHIVYQNMELIFMLGVLIILVDINGSKFNL